MATLWHTVATKDVRLLAHQMRHVFSLPHEYTFLNYLRCHDDIGWGLDYGFLGQFGQTEVPHKKYLNDYLTGKIHGSPARGELYNDDPRLGDARLCGTTASLCGVEVARKKRSAKAMTDALRLDGMLHAFMFTLSGVPVLYSGDEILQENDYTYHDDPDRKDDSRYLHRGKMDWKKAAKRNRETSPEGKMFAALKRMEQIRGEHTVFDSEGDAWLPETCNDHVLAIGRYDRGEQLMALFNFSDEPQTVILRDEKCYTDLISGEKTDAYTVRVEGGGFRWLLRKSDKEGAE